METKEKVNVAPSSTEGHYVENAEKVINIDNINEIFHVVGKSILTTKNHTDLNIEEDCLITCQKVYDPLTVLLINAKD